MSHSPRDWPNLAKEMRDQAAEAAVDGIRALNPVLIGEREFTEIDRLRREFTAVQALHKIFTLMAQAGAPVRMIDL